MDAVAARFLTGLNRQVDLVDPAAVVTYVDVDDTIRRTYGYAKQGSGYGYSGVKGLNVLLGTVSSAGRAPVIVATRLRKGVRELRPRRRAAGRRQPQDHPCLRGGRDGDSSCGQRLLQR